MNTFLTCPADCDTALVLGAIDVQQDCTTYVQKYSQVCDVLLTPTGAPQPLDWTGAPTVTAVAGAVDNADTVGGKSKWIVGEGGIAVPEKVTDEYPKRKSKTNFRVYTLIHTIKNMSDEMYDFLLQLQCGSTAFSFAYATVGAKVFGGANGISVNSIDVDFPKGEGRDDKELAILTITWEADGDPPRGDAPAAYEV